jgi:hypothetical protein
MSWIPPPLLSVGDDDDDIELQSELSPSSPCGADPEDPTDEDRESGMKVIPSADIRRCALLTFEWGSRLGRRPLITARSFNWVMAAMSCADDDFAAGADADADPDVDADVDTFRCFVGRDGGPPPPRSLFVDPRERERLLDEVRFVGDVKLVADDADEVGAEELLLLAVVGLPPDFSSSRFRRSCRRRMVEFQWFFTELSVRPGRSLAISAHLFPKVACASRIIRSSSAVHGSFLIPGGK